MNQILDELDVLKLQRMQLIEQLEKQGKDATFHKGVYAGYEKAFEIVIAQRNHLKLRPR